MRSQQAAWEEAQKWERAWWLSNSQLHSVEIEKGNTVACWMGIRDMPSTTVIDIGCGPFSLLQRVKTAAGCAVDPIDYGPLELAYQAAGIERICCRGEELSTYLNGRTFDEAWIYNCLQHVEEPAVVLQQAMRAARTARIFEWINIPPYQGHLHMLTAASLSQPFLAEAWKLDFQLTGFADSRGLNGEFYAGMFSSPAQAN